MNLITSELKTILSLHDSTFFISAAVEPPSVWSGAATSAAVLGKQQAPSLGGTHVSEAGAPRILGLNVLTTTGRYMTESPDSTFSGNSQTQQ